ncbi:MAG: ACP phosphodiesterase [Bacteroidota bacterium]
MNYLAHAYLSGKDDDILVGNFIADGVKGKAIDNYSGNIKKGIMLHRAIDHFTDHHPVQRASRLRLHERYSHYSGVLVDIFYDHYLAKNWSEYSKEPLEEFTGKVYQLLVDHRDIIPERINYMLNFMIPQNWLLNYAKLEGIERVLNGMANRTQFDSHMEHGVEDLKQHYSEFEFEFREFFPDLINFSKEKIISL